MTTRLKRTLIAATGVAALVGGGAAIAAAAGGDDSGDKAITGSARDRAESVALKATGGGKVTGTEVNDEEGAYEVEVTRGDGSQVDVHLDSSFHVLNAKPDGEGADRSGPDDR